MGDGMDDWELIARESIRDLVARYNANGDTGRFDQVVDLFAPDAVMEAGDGEAKVGLDEIRSIFTTARENARYGEHPVYLRHMTATHQIDVVDATTARGRCYYLVLTAIGLDHWGRYVDEYKVVDGKWKFSRRRVTVDGQSPESVFLPKET
ncbi:MAG: nuclear transport factor 2 family protein [Acidimicrobiales bacterium]